MTEPIAHGCGGTPLQKSTTFVGGSAHKGLCRERYAPCDAILPLPHPPPFVGEFGDSPTKAYAVSVTPLWMRYYPSPIRGRIRPQRLMP